VAAYFNAARAFGKRYWPPAMSWLFETELKEDSSYKGINNAV
jgi:hypothetical protein